jgi:hypothetical protein
MHVAMHGTTCPLKSDASNQSQPGIGPSQVND